MKESCTSKTSAALFFITIFFGLAPHALVAGSDHHSFDSLFPKTWYTKATESCAQVWGAFEDLHAYPSASPRNRSIIIDAAIGRLVFAQFCVDLLATEQDQTVSPDDVAYLARVIEQLDDRYVKCAGGMERDRAYCVKRVIDDLKKKVALLKSKHSLLGADH